MSMLGRNRDNGNTPRAAMCYRVRCAGQDGRSAGGLRAGCRWPRRSSAQEIEIEELEKTRRRCRDGEATHFLRKVRTRDCGAEIVEP